MPVSFLGQNCCCLTCSSRSEYTLPPHPVPRDSWWEGAITRQMRGIQKSMVHGVCGGGVGCQSEAKPGGFTL